MNIYVSIAAMAPKPKLTEKYPSPTGSPRRTPRVYSCLCICVSLLWE